MPYSLTLALAACLLTLALTPAVMALARRGGALDHPGPRRIHREPVPTLGGLAFIVTVLGVAWLARVLPGPARALDVRPLLGLTLAAVPMLALGLVDDVRGAGPWTKLAVQACAAMVLVHFGYGVPLLTNPFGAPIGLGPLSGPLAVVMGSEQYGLSDFWLRHADLAVRIPMAGQADSLNVAMATIVTLFEAVRQRQW